MRILFPRLWGVWLLVLAAAAIAGVVSLYSPKPDFPAGGVQEATLDLDGRHRMFSFFVPETLVEGARVVFAFHPSQGRGAEMRRVVGHVLEEEAVRGNAIVVYPDGFEGHFNDCRLAASYSARELDVDDVAFVEAIIAYLAARYPLDEEVFAFGYSNGGHMALRLALERPGLIAGIAVIAANLPAPANMACSPVATPAPRAVFIEGSEDPINPLEGGNVTLFGFGNRGQVLSAQESAQWFVSRLGLDGGGSTSMQDANGLKARQSDWSGAAGGVRLLVVEGGGHTVPQSRYRYPRIFGRTFESDRLLRESWQFLLKTEADTANGGGR